MIAASGMRTRTIQIAASSSAPVDARLFGGWGYVSGEESTDPIVCAVSGTAVDDGTECIGLMDSTKLLMPGERVEVRDVAMFKKPGRMSHTAASQLPLLALTAAAALHSAGLPPGVASVGTDSAVPARVVVAGSSGRVASLMTGLLVARGVDTYVAAQTGTESQWCDLGVHPHNLVDHNEHSFCKHVGAADAVIDCVGRESEAPVSELREAMGAVYVSVAPPTLIGLEEDGALAQLKAWGRRWWPAGGSSTTSPHGGAQQQVEQPVWVSDAAAGEALAEVLELIEQGKIQAPKEANALGEIGELYMEWLTWARDTETGLRCGFPGHSLWPATPDVDCID